MNIQQTAQAIKHAFQEGYYSYATACGAMNTLEEAWQNSQAKEVHDRLLIMIHSDIPKKERA